MTVSAKGLRWGFKFVDFDLTTDDHRGGRYRYRPGMWCEAPGPFTTDDACPAYPGDGLCVARNLSGAQSGGQRLGRSVMLLVGYHEADVLAATRDKVRVRRLYVYPDPIDPVAATVGPGANLYGANLSGADLSGADLRRANLRRADLYGADLRRANLRRADLCGADLSGAYLYGADLSGADLSGADLSGADLSGADLSGANLRRADLRRADLSGADLSGANLRRADLRRADIYGADLSGADLSGADISGADIRRANLEGTSRPAWLPDRWTVTANGYVVEASASGRRS